MTPSQPKQNKTEIHPATPIKRENNNPLLSLNIVIFLLFLVFCFMLFKNISYPLLWNDESHTAMNAKQILRYGYPKGHDEKNNMFLPADTSWMGYKPEYDANIAMPWGNYYFAVIGVWMADHVQDMYAKTALVRIPFTIMSLTGIIIFMLSLSGFFVSKRDYQWFIIFFILIELFSVSLFLNMREARYYSLIIFITACFFNVIFNYHFFKKYSVRKYILLMTVILFFTYQITFITFSVFCLTMGLFELRYRLSGLILKLKQKAKFGSALGEEFRIGLLNLVPVLIALIIISPFLVFFETFALAAKGSAYFGFTMQMYKAHLQRIYYVFVTQEFLYAVMAVKVAQVFVWFLSRSSKPVNKQAATDDALQKLTFFMTLFFVCYCLMVSRFPFIFTRYFIVLQPVMIMIMLVDALIVLNYISTHLAKTTGMFLKVAFVTTIALIFAFRAGTKINYLKDYTYQLTTQYKGPLDYLIPFIQSKYPKTDTLVLATNYEALSYIYYLNCKVIQAYMNKNLKEDLKHTPDVIIFRKDWGREPSYYNQYIQKFHYGRTSFPVADYFVNDITELDFVIQHQFKTQITDDEREKTDIFTLAK